MKNKYLLLSALAALFLLLPLSPIKAQNTATDSAQEIQNDLKERIKKSVDQNISDQTLGQQASLRAFVGLIESISEGTISITVNPNHGSATVIKQAIVGDDTTLNRVGQTNATFQDLEIGNYIIAMGTQKNETTLQAQRVVVDDYSPPARLRRIAYSQIANIEDDQISFKNNSPYLQEPLTVSSSTALSTVDRQDLKLSDLQTNQPVTLILSVDSDDQTDVELLSLMAFPASTSDSNPDSAATDSAQPSTCGDGVCQEVVCQGLGCSEPETPETCPADCTEN